MSNYFSAYLNSRTRTGFHTAVTNDLPCPRN